MRDEQRRALGSAQSLGDASFVSLEQKPLHFAPGVDYDALNVSSAALFVEQRGLEPISECGRGPARADGDGVAVGEVENDCADGEPIDAWMAGTAVRDVLRSDVGEEVSGKLNGICRARGSSTRNSSPQIRNSLAWGKPPQRLLSVSAIATSARSATSCPSWAFSHLNESTSRSIDVVSRFRTGTSRCDARPVKVSGIGARYPISRQIARTAASEPRTARARTCTCTIFPLSGRFHATDLGQRPILQVAVRNSLRHFLEGERLC